MAFAPKYLLDTNICICIARHAPRSVQTRFATLKPGEAVISVITFGELLYGAARSDAAVRVRKALDEFAAAVPAMPLPVNASREYGDLRATLEAKGKPIGGNDLWIAAHALAAQLTLVTNNGREFRRVPGLTVENWL